ncbi:amidohydrolase family protein [Clostridiaceae bacterium UIB06]|uniref:Amidohydrolase family protein n=1 Tax=Clostridium thailandense TaxID=2794346 RepID=A0A949U0M9_9CLOT|nr:amidohydrolase family protein [Clostridium thailandense]MBV7274094.1 amidohydrolase family protein [Clostridium thailandense]MCH5137682.1 amidohydrolase family protein [Clostridiaceae bacterium UIB06]
MDIWDIVIKNGKLVNPERESVVHCNIGISGGKISIITEQDIKGKEEIDAKNKIVCPGFIDIHAHIDGDIGCAKLSLVQGVTTTVGGNCGGGPIDLKKFFDEQDKKGFPINQAQFVGHSFSLRERVGVTDPYISSTSSQIKQMQDLAEKAFKEGGVGLSFGLEYAPGASFDEVIELSRVAARHGRLVSIHTRLSAPDDLDSLREAIKIAELTGVSVQISHLVYQYGAGVMSEAIELISNARKSGLNIWADSGMYTSFATHIVTSVFDEEHIKNFGWEFNHMFIASGKHKGQSLTEELYRSMRNNKEDAVIICFTGVEDEIYEALLSDYVMLSSDTGPSPTGNIDECHPQNAGSFPRFFRKMVREQKSISVIEAVKKCTLVPAEALGFSNKGRLNLGTDADLLVIDMERIIDKSDFSDKGRPDAYPEGIDYVIVNGKIVVDKGQIREGVMPGKSIRVV